MRGTCDRGSEVLSRPDLPGWSWSTTASSSNMIRGSSEYRAMRRATTHSLLRQRLLSSEPPVPQSGTLDRRRPRVRTPGRCIRRCEMHSKIHSLNRDLDFRYCASMQAKNKCVLRCRHSCRLMGTLDLILLFRSFLQIKLMSCFMKALCLCVRSLPINRTCSAMTFDNSTSGS
ncbi:hypothetical protein HYPSUDRAFT_576868 [Hypholoma sublateritium FD-334 SS-4]|uniref:Uncharacterized protein n=1 Tax=Hypholoma sublateritium (strain FD-334 SS-4) TaxID=945553 RepID=A0A0D2N216_HYPSF|nr:hypothetical protein HYPSUDRAFT_576868 [Hypholoma sublateritium FD-334 SS-4]